MLEIIKTKKAKTQQHKTAPNRQIYALPDRRSQLDADLQVVTANRAFCQYFQVKAEDTIGHRVYDLGNGQWNIPALRKLLDEILPVNGTFEGYVVESDFPGLGLRKIILNARRILREKRDRALILLAMEVTHEQGPP